MENRFIRAEDVAQELNVSKPYAYKLIRQLNEELKAKGFITIAGRVNRQYFYERLIHTIVFSETSPNKALLLSTNVSVFPYSLTGAFSTLPPRTCCIS